MKHAKYFAVAALCVACSSKGPDDPAPTKKAAASQAAPTRKAAPASAAASAPATRAAKPAAPAKPAPLVARARSFGGVDEKTAIDRKAVEAALPGYTITRQETQSEGDTYVSFSVELGGKALANVSEGPAGRGVSVSVSSDSIKDEKGIGLGSTHAQLLAAWPDVKCDLFELKQPTDGVEPFKSIECKVPGAPSLWYRVDVTGVAGIGAKMPATDTIAQRPITSFTATYPPLGGWK